MWQDWVNAILGIWVIITPYLGMSDSAIKSNLVIVGIVIVVLAVWSAMSRSAMTGTGSRA
jgi:hypothetical protein